MREKRMKRGLSLLLAVLMVCTNEELMIARDTLGLVTGR